MRMGKNAIVVLIVIVLGAGYAFAGGQGEESAAEDGQVQLTLLDLNPEGGAAVDAVIEMFEEEYPNISVDHTTMNSRQYDQRIQAVAASGDMPDIPTVQMFPQYKGMAQNDLFMDLRDTEIVNSGKFDELALSALTLRDGTVYGLTWNHLAVGAFYNRDVFEEYDLDIPTDWPSFLEVCETLKQNGVTPIVSPLGDGWTSQYPLYTAGIHTVYGQDPNFDQALVAGDVKFNSEGWVEAFERVKTLYDRGYFGENPMGGKYEQSLSDFANGRGAMLILGTWVIPVFDEINPDLDFSIFPVPFNDEGEQLYAMLESELGMGIAATSENKEAALTFFEFFYEDEPYTTYLEMKKGFSAIEAINVKFHPSVDYIVDNYLSEGHTRPYMSRQWPAGQDLLMFRLFQEVMLGQASIESALNEMDEYFVENLE